MPRKRKHHDDRPTADVGDDANRRLRFALLHALENGTSDTAGDILASIACVIDHADPVHWAAWRMAKSALDAVVPHYHAAQVAVRAWDAHSKGCRDMQTLAILDIAEWVEVCAYVYPRREKWLATRGRAAVVQLRGLLVRNFGGQLRPRSALPTVGELEEWIDRRATGKGKARLATAGVVARIVHRSRLFGAHTEDETKTLRRVDRILARHASAWRRARG